MDIEKKYNIAFDGGWEIESVRQTLLSSRRVVLVAHQNADGDAVGSILGMRRAMALAVPQAEVVAMLPDGCPDELSWLPGSDTILNGQREGERCSRAIKEADLIVTLDLNTLERTGCLAEMLKEARCKRMLVDHHIDPDREVYGVMVSEPEISSTCELVYWVMTAAFGGAVVDKEAATCLYAGICTDTGTFSYSNNHESVYLAAADLIGRGIDPMEINRQIKNTFTPERLRFFGHALANLTTIYGEQGVALMVIRQSEMAEWRVTSAELTGLINEVMKLRDIDCGILVREEEGKVRLSLRSKKKHNVDRIAREMFGGGGHERAAGATSKLSLQATVERVCQQLGIDTPYEKSHGRTKMSTAMMIAALAIGSMGMQSCRQVPVIEQATEVSDTMREHLINANRYISGSEERQIEGYLSRRGWDTARLTGGARVRETSRGNGRAVMYEDTLSITYSVEAIDGTRIYRPQTDTVVAGHLKPTRGLDAAMLTMCHEGEATVVLPSEQAYGVAGDGDRIGPRMIVVYKLKINN